MIRFAHPLFARIFSALRPSWLLLAVFWLLSVGTTAAVTWRLARQPSQPLELASWDVPRLADELNRRGLPVIVNMDAEQATDGLLRSLPGGAVLTDASAPWVRPPAACVYVVCDGRAHQHSPPPMFRDAPEVGRIGPFHFHGDAGFFRRIEAALR